MYNCINFAPIRENVPENMRYFMVTKEYPKPTPRDGNKKVTKEQTKQYNEMIKDREKMFKELVVGNIVDMGNSYIKMEDITKNIQWLINYSNNYFIYKIKPINACKYKERYVSSEEIRVSSFEVEKIMESVTELLDDLSSSIYYHDAFNNIFDHTYYLSKRDTGLELFRYFNKKYPDKKIYISDCLYNNLHSYDKHSRYKNEDIITKFAEVLYDNELIELFEEYADHEYIVGELIKAGWFKIATEYIRGVKNLNYSEIYFKDKYKDDVLSVIKLHTDNEYITEIIGLLGIEDTYITLVVNEYVNDGYDTRIIEEKQFATMNEARSYVIKEYNVSFEDAAKDVSRWRVNDNEELYFEIK